MPETQRRPTLRSYTSGNSYFYFAVFLGAIILVATAVMSSYKASLLDQINTIDGQIDQQEKARNKDQEKELVDASKQSKIIRQLVDSKLYWSQALDAIERMMQTSVTLDSIAGDATSGEVTFKATATTYAGVAQQLAAFVDATGIKDIAPGDISATSDGAVEFSGDLMIDSKALLMKPKMTPTPRP